MATKPYNPETDKLATPIRSIRMKCYDCSNFQWNEVKWCTSSDCPLFPYRLGRRPKVDVKGVATSTVQTPESIEEEQ